MNPYIINENIVLIPDKHIERGKLIRILNSNKICLNTIDYCLVILHNTNGDYSIVFKSVGVNSESLKACAEWAISSIKHII